MNFILSTDSCVDELKQNLDKYNVNVIPMSVILGDDIFKDEFLEEEQYKNFYEKIKDGEIFKTSSLNSTEVEEFFENLLKQNKDIIHISLSSGLSVTYNIVKEVAERINEKNKNKIFVLDSLSATQGQNLLMRVALSYQNQQINAFEAFEKLKNIVSHLDVSFFVSDFDCLKRGGRVNGLQAVIGRFANIRPILDFDLEGKLRVLQKIMGTKKAMNALIERLSNFDKESSLPVLIAHTGNHEMTTEFEKAIRERLGEVEVIKNYIGATIGSHTGAGALGLVFLGKGERR